jgi:hypothetical protein
VAIAHLKTVRAAAHKALDGALSAELEVAPIPNNYPPTPEASIRKTAHSNNHVEPTGDLSGPEQRILNAIAWLASTTGCEGCEQTAVAFLAGYTYGGGAFNNPRGRLKTRGLVTYRGALIELTDAGRAVAQAPEEALTAGELHQRVLDRLPGPEQRILKPLLQAYPNAMDGVSVAKAANYTFGAGAFNNPRGRLKSLGLIEYIGGQMRAVDSLFPAS